MMEERNARRFALNQEEAARLTAGTRDHGMGAAALREMRREADAMAKRMVCGSQAGLIPVQTDANAASTPPPSRRRAALYHVLRR